MKHRKLHWLEKVQVQLATLAGVVVVYVFFASAFGSVDPHLPIVFLPAGNYAQIAALAVLLWALAGVCAIVTLTSRPEGSLLAALFAVGGVSLSSPSIKSLLWTSPAEVGGLLGQLAIEMVFMTVLLVGAVVVVAVVRQLGKMLAPAIMWRDPLTELTGYYQSDDEDEFVPRGWMKYDPIGLAALLGIYLLGKKGDSQARSAQADKAIGRVLLCLAASLLFTIILVSLLMRSQARGQVIFAVIAGSFLAVLIAHQLFPTPFSVVAWLSPLLAGLLIYAFSAQASASGQPGNIPLYANALPIDWLTGGGGGGMLGFWVSSRIFEARHFEKFEAELQG